MLVMLGLFTEILFEKYVHSHVLVVRWSEVCCCFSIAFVSISDFRADSKKNTSREDFQQHVASVHIFCYSVASSGLWEVERDNFVDQWRIERVFTHIVVFLLFFLSFFLCICLYVVMCDAFAVVTKSSVYKRTKNTRFSLLPIYYV